LATSRRWPVCGGSRLGQGGSALKEFADLRIDLKILAAQVLLQWVESSNTDPE
jgi:hypothetical protein